MLPRCSLSVARIPSRSTRLGGRLCRSHPSHPPSYLPPPRCTHTHARLYPHGAAGCTWRGSPDRKAHHCPDEGVCRARNPQASETSRSRRPWRRPGAKHSRSADGVTSSPRRGWHGAKRHCVMVWIMDGCVEIQLYRMCMRGATYSCTTLYSCTQRTRDIRLRG